MKKLQKERLNDFVKSFSKRHFNPRITKQQLLTEPMIVGSWGAYDWGYFDEDHLIFKVNGAIHKGYVVITLGWEDLYEVTLLDEMIRVVAPTKRGIYVDVLVEVVDKLVETRV